MGNSRDLLVEPKPLRKEISAPEGLPVNSSSPTSVTIESSVRVPPLINAKTTHEKDLAAIEKLATEEVHQASLVDGNLVLDGITFLEGLSSCVSLDQSDARGTFLHISLPGKVSEAVVDLGTPTFSKFMASSRQKVWWMVPAWGKDVAEIPNETQFLLLKLSPDNDSSHERFAVILPLLSGPFRTALRPTPTGTLALRVETGDAHTTTDQAESAAFVAVGADPFALLSQAFAAAADRLQTFRPREGKQLPQYFDVFGYCTWNAFYGDLSAPRIEKEIESFRAAGVPAKTLIIDDGWQDTVNPYQVARKTKTSVATVTTRIADVVGWTMRQLASPLVAWFYKRHVLHAPTGSFLTRMWRWLATRWPLKGVLEFQFADDKFDWSRRLRSPDPNSKFLSTIPSGNLADFVSGLKQDKGVNQVWMWHSLLGYWGGVQPDKTIWPNETHLAGAKPMESILAVESQMAWDPLVLSPLGLTPPDKLYDTMHSRLAAAGVDGVKIDIQGVTTMLGDGRGGSRRLTQEYVSAAEDSVRKHFGSSTQMINCMSHPTENLYAVRASSVVRASDDFWPDDPASHSTHLVHVAYNSLFIGEIAGTDWDMFQSKHEAAGLHAAARAVGGCPVYVSDAPGEHNFDLLRRLVLPDGSILRAGLPGRPTRDTLFADVTKDGRSAMKVWNRNRCNGVLGAFNVQGASWDKVRRGYYLHRSQPGTIHVRLSPKDVEGLVTDAASKWVMATLELNGRGDLVNASTCKLQAAESMTVALPPQHSVVAAVAAVQSARGGDGAGVEWAALGLEGMLNGGGAVEAAESVRAEGAGAGAAQVAVRGEGTLMLHCDRAPAAVHVDQRPVTDAHYCPRSRILRVPVASLPGVATVRVEF